MWLNPVMLWGLLAVSVPIILHILNFFRQRRQPWAAMDLLREALEQRNVQVQMEDRLLLVLRCLALAFLALAFARPVWHGSSTGGGDTVAALVLVDGSYSMEHGAGITRFENARAKAREVLSSIAPGSSMVTVALMGRRLAGIEGQVLVRNQPLDPEAVRRRLEEARPLDEPFDPAGCAADLETLLGDFPSGMRREVYLVTDAQRRDWDNPPPAWRQALDNAARQGATIRLVPAGGAAYENVALTGFRLVGGELRRQSLARYEATLRNYGARARANVPVTLSLNGQKIDEKVAPEIGPHGGEAVVSLTVRFPEAGLQRLAAAVAADELPRDNVRSLVAWVRASDSVLIVIDPGDEQGGVFLRTALAAARVAGPAAAPLAVRAATPDGLPGEPLEDVDVVLVSDVDRLPPAARDRLAAFVRAGGGAAFFAGRNAVPSEWNAWAGPDGPLLPAELGDPVERGDAAADPFADDAGGGADDAWRLRLGDAGHALALSIATLPQELTREMRVTRRFPLRPRGAADGFAGGAAPALWLAAAPDGEGGAEGPEPWAVGGRYGRGRVLLFGVPPDRRWSNWPITAMFPVLVDRTIGWLSARDFERPLAVRAPLVLDLPEPRFAARAVVKDPDGASATVDLERGPRGPALRFDGTGRAGFYEVAPAAEAAGAFAKPADDGPPLVVAVNVEADSGEGDARVLGDQELRERLADWPVRVFERTAGDLAPIIRTERTGRELGRWFLLLAVLTFLAETVLAYRFGRRVG